MLSTTSDHKYLVVPTWRTLSLHMFSRKTVKLIQVITKGGITHSSTKTGTILRFIAFRAIMTESHHNSP